MKIIEVEKILGLTNENVLGLKKVLGFTNENVLEFANENALGFTNEKVLELEISWGFLILGSTNFGVSYP